MIQFICKNTIFKGGIILNKSATVVARINPTIKKKVSLIFEHLGITTSEAVNLFYNQVLLNNGLPFEVKIPNESTLKVFKDSDEGKNLNTYKNVDDMLKSLKF